MLELRENVRNIAIIAHVDHGKTTLVDELLKQSGTFRKNQNVMERVMDSGDIERERGITILSKNTAVNYNGVKINIIDTPGHADFGGEVERVLKMADGVVLVVDAFEGPMPQTKFVLKNALSLDLPVVVCVNKIDRPEARPSEVTDEVLELYFELDASEEQIDCPFVYASAKNGYATLDYEEKGEDMAPLFETIISHISPPKGDPDAPFQLLISTIDYNEYIGRIGIGKISDGVIKINSDAMLLNITNPDFSEKIKISKLYEFEGLNRQEVLESSYGAIVAISGVENLRIGDTVTSIDRQTALPFVSITEPTIAMNFSVNDSPFAGNEGTYVTSRHLRERLFKELNTDVSLRVEDTETMETFKVSGRGELHLSILIETMRREGYEFQVSKPEVLFKEVDGKIHEPMEIAVVDVPEKYVGAVIEKLGSRRAEMTNMTPSKDGYTRLEFSIPARGLVSYRSEFMTDTNGNGILNSIFDGYAPYKGDIVIRQQGSLIAFEAGETTIYGLHGAQERGSLFITPGTKVYAGMIVGKSARALDINVNVCKKKHLTNIRASGSDDALKLVSPIIMSLEQSLEFIEDDELIEVTPVQLRIRKKILDNTQRARSKRK